MILGAEIALLAMGIYALVSGKLVLSKNHVVRGPHARMLALIAFLPWPLAFTAGFSVAFVAGVKGNNFNPQDHWGTLTLIEAGIVIACCALIYVIGMPLSGPPDSSAKKAGYAPSLGEMGHSTEIMAGSPRGGGHRFRSFSVTAVYTFSRDQLYRVFVEDGNLYFIRMAGQLGIHSVSHGMVEALDEQSPRELVGKSKHEMTIAIEDVSSSSLDPPAAFGGHGVHAGVWRLAANGKKWKFQIPDVDEMKRASVTLPAALGSTLEITAYWNEEKQKFTK